ncbi:Histidyl-tRNA synthetase [Klebsormidium nitens]|uniref:Histidine--tRNA ligase, cytoplasmic n=1 Tax=Klebsormidium nitens TaxID=105231 RepID=A0A1Y1HKH8_KLENI|nr:Histidyl-tRNA synthetase [Klebsormidium nitens]|eukprot:GAQ79094.1 Histidyl-tRNA synthetase [Klebsormidium nitens]
MAPSKGKAGLTLGGIGSSLSVADVYNVAAKKGKVALDTAALEKLAKTLAARLKGDVKVKDAEPEETNEAAASGVAKEWLSDPESRAALLVKLTELINSGALRPAALQFFESVLNSQVTLSLPSSATDAPILRALAGGADGNWNAPQIGVQQEKAVETLAGNETGVSKPPGLSAAEKVAVGQGIAASVGVSALAVFEAERLVEIIDAVGALTCEALGAVTTGFDADVHDVGNPHKCQVEVASDLRSLLEGSTLVNPRKGGLNTPAVSAMPQWHGPLRGTVRSASSAVRVEFASGGGAPEGASADGELSGGGSKTGGAEYVPSPQVVIDTTVLLMMLRRVVGLSVDRICELVKALEGLEVPEGQGASKDPDALVRTAHDALAKLGVAAENASTTMAGGNRADGVSSQIPRVKIARDALSGVQTARGIFAAEAFLAGKLLKAKETALAGKVGGKGGKEIGGKGEGPKETPKNEAAKANSNDEKKQPKDTKKSPESAENGAVKTTGIESGVAAVSLDGPTGKADKKAVQETDGQAPSTSGAPEANTADGRRQPKEGSADGKQKSEGGRGKGRAAKPEGGSEQGGAERGRGRGGAKASEKAEKKAKKGGVALGKGTALVKEFVDGVFAREGGEDRAVLAALSVALDPLSKELGELVGKVKEALESNAARRKPKIAKGARDFMPEQMAIREKAFATITAVFKRHGAVSLDTPVFELRETLTGKYGEDSKLIYDLADQGGEILSLRYDLTVPFARYVAMHNIAKMKRYHIARVYRRDQPQMARGRYREFYQCDFDIAGEYAPMVPDAEVLKVSTEILDDLKIGDYEIKLNHRKLLDAMLDICGVPAEKFRPICSAIDKLDKEDWADVRAEMVDDKGLAPEAADKIEPFVRLKGEPLALLQELQGPSSGFSGHAAAQEALADLALLFEYLGAMGALKRISFDLSLARGLDYYTGVIYEAVFKGASQVGSIAAGGRYDGLVGMFSGKNVPAVGVSLGIERVFAIMEEQARAEAERAKTTLRKTQTEVLVASIGPNLLIKRMELCTRLWEAGVKAEFLAQPKPNMDKQLTYALEEGIPFMVIFGETELAQGIVAIKDLKAGVQENVKEGELVAELRKRLSTQQA